MLHENTKIYLKTIMQLSLFISSPISLYLVGASIQKNKTVGKKLDMNRDKKNCWWLRFLGDRVAEHESGEDKENRSGQVRERLKKEREKREKGESQRGPAWSVGRYGF